MGLIPTGLFARLSRRLTCDPIARGLFEARITHARFTPRPYVLSHKLSYFHVPLSALERVPRLFLARNRPGLFALYDKDYGAEGTTSSPASWVAAAFAAAGTSLPPGEVALVTMPRVGGIGFNPVSFWLCHDLEGRLSAVLAEVNNTFGERHCYLAKPLDGMPIGPGDEIEAEKVFHVSPFMPLDGTYRFRFIEKKDRLAIRVDLYRNGRRALSATMSGRLVPLTSANLLKSFLRHPFPSAQILLLIHYHAARLFLAGHKVFRRPAAPERLVTASRAISTTSTATEPL